MLCESSSPNWISGSAMIVGLKTIHVCLERDSTGIFSNIFSSFWNISHSRRTPILNVCASLTRTVTEYKVKWTPAKGRGISKISFLPERQLSQLFVHPTIHHWPISLVISIAGHCISRVAIFEKTYSTHLHSAPEFLLGGSHVPQKERKILMRKGILQLELCCLHSRILTHLVLAWNGIVLMDFRDNVTLSWLPGLGIIPNKSWLLKSHMGHAQCVKFLQMCRWRIQLFDHLTNQDISLIFQSFWTKLRFKFCTLFMFIQSTTSAGNSLSAMSISFGSLMNCISCSSG